jgi:SMC interacting uncharacterized protein involved in chromosome segregation
MDTMKIAERVARTVVAESDPAVETYNYFMDYSRRDVEGLKKSLAYLEKELESIRKQIAGLDKLGSGKIEAQSFIPLLRKAIAPIKSTIDNIDRQAEHFSRR